MPEPELYVKGFNIKNGSTFGQYQMFWSHIGHHSIVRYNEYSYPTELAFRWTGSKRPTDSDIQSFLNQFTEFVSGVRVIESHSGRPYKCYFQWPLDTTGEYSSDDDNTTITLKFTGYAKRIGADEAASIKRGEY